MLDSKDIKAAVLSTVRSSHHGWKITDLAKHLAVTWPDLWQAVNSLKADGHVKVHTIGFNVTWVEKS